MQPIFETSLKDNANLSRIQIFEIISSYGLIVISNNYLIISPQLSYRFGYRYPSWAGH